MTEQGTIEILLVEDDPAQAELVQMRLRSGTVTVAASVSDLATAIDAVTQRRFDAVLLDLTLPDGQDLDSLEALQPHYDGPIVILTGHDDPAMGLRAVRLGAQDYLSKEVANGPIIERVIRYSVERYRDRQRLRDMARARDEFLAVISHELRTPLTPLVGCARLLVEDKELTDSDKTELLELITEQAQQLHAIVEDLLVAARTDIGGITVNAEVIDLAPIARRTVTAFGRGRVQIDIRAPEVPVVADPVRVVQVARNLVTNAIRYGGDRITVIVGSEETAGFMEVIDDGAGIPSDQVERVFKPYERLEATRRNPGSVGLGLPIARYLAEIMGGSLDYERRSDQSVFRMSLKSAGDTTPLAVPIRPDHGRGTPLS